MMQHGRVLQVFIPHGKKFAYVSFDDNAAKEEVLRKREFEFEGCKVRVEVAKRQGDFMPGVLHARPDPTLAARREAVRVMGSMGQSNDRSDRLVDSEYETGVATGREATNGEASRLSFGELESFLGPCISVHNNAVRGVSICQEVRNTITT